MGIARSRRYKVTTLSYLYTLFDANGREVLGYHWQPEEKVAHPHLHVGPGAEARRLSRKVHLPTGRIALEALLRCAIEDLGVDRERDDWDKVLAKSQADFEQHRTRS
jgi:hypothetical protein